MQSAKPHVSFVIPARNEERYIGDTLASIRRFCPDELLCEIIVVDHGSTDRTREIAEAGGATVLRPSVETIGALRNEGARVAKGNVLVFLDGDVTLTDAWRAEAPQVIEQVLHEPGRLAGSNCDVPESDNWFLRYWFKELAKDQSPTTIGSAHMIISRDSFERLGGFDPRLKTGEDPDLCIRARTSGGRLTPSPALRVIHHGYPLTVGAFVRRERWHGGGDMVSLTHAIRSKIVWMSLVFLALHLALLAGLFVSRPLAAISVALLLLHLYVSARVRMKNLRGTAVLRVMAILYLYYLGRGLAIFKEHKRGAR